MPGAPRYNVRSRKVRIRFWPSDGRTVRSPNAHPAHSAKARYQDITCLDLERKDALSDFSGAVKAAESIKLQPARVSPNPASCRARG